MKVIVGMQTEQGLQILGNDDNTGPLVFDTLDDAVELLVEKTEMPAMLLPMLGYQFFEVTEEEIEEIKAQVLGE